jgi:hypothetical protein
LAQHGIITAEFSAAGREISRASLSFAGRHARPSDFRRLLTPSSLALLLRCGVASIRVIRTGVVSIALTLTVWQQAGLLCLFRCDPPVPTTSACHHEDGTTATVVAGAEGCGNMVSGQPALLEKQVGRVEGGLEKQHAAPVPRYHFAPFSTCGRFGQKPEHVCALEQRPFVTALRI